MSRRRPARHRAGRLPGASLGALSALALASCLDIAPIELASPAPDGPPARPDASAVLETTQPAPDPEGPLFPASRRYHIELTWRRATPGDTVTAPSSEPTGPTNPTSPAGPAAPGDATGRDPAPSADAPPRELGPPSGADLDLHFLHPFAVGRDLDRDGHPDGWFDIPFDVHWANPSPTWGHAKDQDDDGRLDRDDRAGPGPEVISLDLCAAGEAFRIGVHVFSDPVGTPLIARVDLFVDGQRAFGISARLLHQDFWEVGALTCDGRVALEDRLIPAVAVAPSW